MICIVWNARGLRSSRAFHELRRLVADHSPDLFFICESKSTKQSTSNWRAILGFSGLFVVDATGRSGGLLLFWKNTCDVNIKSFSSGHIDCMVTMQGQCWRFTGFYGNPEVSLRPMSWTLLRRLFDREEENSIPWLIGGDFNEICFESEKVGGRPRSQAQMQKFREVIDDCSLQELVHGALNSLTWYNKRKEGDAVAERLDRFLASRLWCDSFPEARVHPIDLFGSDHRPLLLQIHNKTGKAIDAGVKRFFFEDKWFLDKTFIPDFLLEWKDQDGSIALPSRLAHCQRFLTTWAGERFNMLSKKIKSLRQNRLNVLNQDQPFLLNIKLKGIDQELDRLTESLNIMFPSMVSAKFVRRIGLPPPTGCSSVLGRTEFGKTPNLEAFLLTARPGILWRLVN